VGGNHACAVLEDNSVRCWGYNELGQLGLGRVDNIGDDEFPSQIAPIVFFDRGPFDVISAGPLHTCAKRAQAPEVQCWGYNGDGSLGFGEPWDEPYRKATELGEFAWGGALREVAVGDRFRCVVENDYSLKCWGFNEKAQLGLPSTDALGDDEWISSVGPVDLGTVANGNPIHAVMLAVGQHHSCVLLEPGNLKCWGYNAQGQIGLGYVSPPPLDYVGGTQASVPAKLPAVRVFPP
jgi:alpha-tubulin suppressor-like RCC1 family protein